MTYSYCELTDFNHDKLKDYVAYKSFANADLATLLKSYFIPERELTSLHMSNAVMSSATAIKDHVEKDVFDHFAHSTYLPVIPFNVPLSVPIESDSYYDNCILKNPKWLIRSESLIDEKILGI